MSTQGCQLASLLFTLYSSEINQDSPSGVHGIEFRRVDRFTAG